MLSREHRDAVLSMDLALWFDEYVNVKHLNREQIQLQECPICGHDRYKLYVHLYKLVWYCQRCSWGRHQNDITVLMSKVSGRHINEIKLEIAQFAVPSKSSNDIKKILEKDDEEDFFYIEPVIVPGDSDLTSRRGKKAVKYLKSRGFTDEDILKYDVQAAFVLPNNNSDKEDHKGPFVVFPVKYYNLPVNWQARRLGHRDPKYVSGPHLKKWLWPLTKETINALESSKVAYITEGIFDSCALHKIGLTNTVNTFGKAISNDQVDLLKTHKVEELRIVWDPDALTSILSLYDRLNHLFNLKIINLSDLETDPADLILSDKGITNLKKILSDPKDLTSKEVLKLRLKA